MPTDTAGLDAAIKALTDSFASGDIVLACVAAVLISIVVLLKFLGKKVPLVDTGVVIIIDIVRRFAPKKIAPGVAAVVPVVKDGEPAKSPDGGVSNVIEIKKDS